MGTRLGDGSALDYSELPGTTHVCMSAMYIRSTSRRCSAQPSIKPEHYQPQAHHLASYTGTTRSRREDDSFVRLRGRTRTVLQHCHINRTENKMSKISFFHLFCRGGVVMSYVIPALGPKLRFSCKRRKIETSSGQIYSQVWTLIKSCKNISIITDIKSQ